MKILFAASECVPFVKTGGLADVVGALPKEIRKSGADVRVILPLYRDVAPKWRDQMEHLTYFYVNLGWRRQYCGIETLKLDGVTFYFIDNEFYYNRPSVYGWGGDEGERFAFFDRAVLEALPLIDYKPDILHCHDWQTGLIPVLLKRQYAALPFYQGIHMVFTIHNLQYQGVFGMDYIEDPLGLGWDAYTSDKLEFFGVCSFMKGGLGYTDEITTVSPTYCARDSDGLLWRAARRPAPRAGRSSDGHLERHRHGRIRSRTRSGNFPHLFGRHLRAEGRKQDGAAAGTRPEGRSLRAHDRHGQPPVRPEGAGSGRVRAQGNHGHRRAARRARHGREASTSICSAGRSGSIRSRSPHASK